MAEGGFPKSDGDILYGSEANKMIKSEGAVIRHNIWTDYDDGDGIIYETFVADVAKSTTNLTHSTTTDEYYSITDGAYELQTKLYLTDSNATAGICGYDYDIYTEITETDLTSASSGVQAADSDLSADLYSYKQVNLKFYCVEFRDVASSTPSEAKISITDNNGHSQILSTPPATDRGTLYSKGSVKLYIDTTNNIVYYEVLYTTGKSVVRTRSSVDISAWDPNLYLQTYADTGESGDTANSTIYYQRSYKPAPSTTAVVSISSDNGSTWDILPNNGYTKFTAGGTEITTKLAGTLAANEGISIRRYYIKPTV